MITDLKDEGWYFTDEGLELCKDGLDKITPEAIVKKALDTDLREIGGPFLSEEIHKEKTDYISGPCVLQIQKLKNVASPKYATGSSTPQLLRMLVTDGHVFVSCLQWGQWKYITLDTPPGTKIKIKPMKIQVQNGFLLLGDKHFNVLGGHVQALYDKWELGKSLASHVRRGEGTEGGPPPWMPFGKSINYKEPTKSGNFKSLEQEVKEDKEPTVFKQQRLANIAEVSKAKEGKTKVFGGGKDKISSTNNDQPGRTFNRDRQSSNYYVKDNYQKNESSNSDRQSSNYYVKDNYQKSESSNSDKQSSNYYVKDNYQKNESGDSDRQSSNYYVKDNFQKNESGNSDKQSSNYYVRENFQRNESARNDRQSSNYYAKENFQKNGGGSSVQSPVHNVQNAFQSMSINNPAQTPEKYSTLQRDDRRPQQPRTDGYRKPEPERFRNYDARNRYDDRSHAKYEADSRPDMRNGYGSPNNRNFGNRYEPNDTRTRNENERTENQVSIKPGSEVMARYWEDKRFYHAKIHAVGENQTCVVQFLEYGNYEEVRVHDIQPFNSNQKPASSNAGYQNNGANFSGVLEFRRGGNKPFVHYGANNDVNQEQQRDRSNRPPARIYQPPRLRKFQ